MTELVRLGVDVILPVGPEASLRAAQEATTTIPIVVVAIDYDPIARGYVGGLARPGGNTTGVFLRQPELTAKRLQLLQEAAPKVRRVVAFWDPFSIDQMKEAEGAAKSAGLQLQQFEFRNPPYRVAILHRTSSTSPVDAFRTAMRNLDWLEGQTILIDYRGADGKAERLDQTAAPSTLLAIERAGLYPLLGAHLVPGLAG
jgi:hypothetical protein